MPHDDDIKQRIFPLFINYTGQLIPNTSYGRT